MKNIAITSTMGPGVKVNPYYYLKIEVDITKWAMLILSL